MALTDYKQQFDNAYQEIFQKVIVGKSIANLRFEPVLVYGGSIARVLPDVSAVRVRTVTRGSASTIDALTDSAETLTVNVEKEAVFHISDGEAKQTGPLNPGEVLGAKIAHLVAMNLDGKILYETINAAQTFDDGDLVTLSSTGTPLKTNSTTIPQIVTRMPAKLKRKENQVLTNMALVVDAYVASDIEQYLLGKQFDIVNSVFKNGYAGAISTAEVYVSEALTGEVTLTCPEGHTLEDAATIIINGVTFTMSSTAPNAVGEISLATGNTAAGLLQTLQNIKVAFEDPDTTVAGIYYPLSAANAAIIAALGLECCVGGQVIRIRAVGGGRLIVSETLSNGAFGSPFLHCYYGKKGAIDVVVQDLSPVDMRETADRRGTNVFSSYLAGIKTFTDGAKKFLDVQILS